jgi:hypothetical protein
MTFCALEAFPRTAIVTNENFFSHANLVLRRAEEIAKRCFPRGARPRTGCGPKKSMFFRKKRLASHIPVSTMRLESGFSYEHHDCSKAFVFCPLLRRGPCALRFSRHTVSLASEYDRLQYFRERRPVAGKGKVP